MKKLLCKIFGCDWRYNFPSIPSKCICFRCHAKYKINFATLGWDKAESFDPMLGTDEEMKKRWFK